jgi:hypothetical protein
MIRAVSRSQKPINATVAAETAAAAKSAAQI